MKKVFLSLVLIFFMISTSIINVFALENSAEKFDTLEKTINIRTNIDGSTDVGFFDDLPAYDKPRKTIPTNKLFDFSYIPEGIISYDSKGLISKDYWGVIDDPTGQNMGKVAYCAAVHNAKPSGITSGYKHYMNSNLEFCIDNVDINTASLKVEADIFMKTNDSAQLFAGDKLVFLFKSSEDALGTPILPNELMEYDTFNKTNWIYRTEGWQHFTYDLSNYVVNGTGEKILGNKKYPKLYMKFKFTSDGDSLPNSKSKEIYGAYIDNLTIKTAVDYKFGNLPANIINGGFIAKQGECLYYSNKSDGNSLYKIKEDGTYKEKISNDNCSNINVVDEWIYYRNDSDNGRIYKIKKDGTSKTKLNNDDSTNVIVMGNWIYYINKSNDNKIYIINIFGNKRNKLCNEKCTEMIVDKNWIYYAYEAGDGQGPPDYPTKRMKLNGKEKMDIIYGRSGYLNAIGNCIYYVSLSEGCPDDKLSKVKTDGTNTVRIKSYKGESIFIENVIVQDEWIYFTTSEQYYDYENEKWQYKHKLNKTKLNGTESSVLISSSALTFNIIDDWIYYIDYDSNHLYKLKTDGSERSRIDQIRNDKETIIEEYSNRGNTVGNLVNGGSFAQQDQWIYYSPFNGKLYKMRKDGSESCKLNDDNASYINVLGDWIYYSNYSDENRIYKIKKDGSERTRLTTDSGKYLTIKGEWIYYSNESGIYKIRIDGSGRFKITNDNANYVNVVNGWIYYQNESEYYQLYKIKVDGTGKIKIYDNVCDFLNVVDGWVYCITDDALYKIKIDGSEKKKLVDHSCWSLNVNGDWIYFTYSYLNYQICKMKTDGTGFTILNDDIPCGIHVFNNTIYYNYSNGFGDEDDYVVDGGTRIMKTDGTGKIEINEDNDINLEDKYGVLKYLGKTKDEIRELFSDKIQYDYFLRRVGECIGTPGIDFVFACNKVVTIRYDKNKEIFGINNGMTLGEVFKVLGAPDDKGVIEFWHNAHYLNYKIDAYNVYVFYVEDNPEVYRIDIMKKDESY